MRTVYTLVATLFLAAIGCSKADVGEQEAVTQSAAAVEREETAEMVETLDGLPEEFLGTWASWRGKSDVERQTVIRETVFVIAVRDLLADVRERTYYSIEQVEGASNQIRIAALDEDGAALELTWSLDSDDQFSITQPDEMRATFQSAPHLDELTISGKRVVRPEDQLIGDWINVDDQTRGTHRIAITKEDNVWHIKKWNSSMDEAPSVMELRLAGSSPWVKTVAASVDDGVAERFFVVYMDSGRLVLETITLFHNSDGTNSMIKERFKRPDNREVSQ